MGIRPMSRDAYCPMKAWLKIPLPFSFNRESGMPIWSDSAMAARLLSGSPSRIRSWCGESSYLASDSALSVRSSRERCRPFPPLGPLSAEQQRAMQTLSADRLPKAFRDEYARVSPDGPQHWLVFFEKVRAMWSKPDWGISKPELATIKAPVLLFFGDRDFTSLEEAATIFRSIPGAQLCIVPGVGHGTFRDRPEWLNPVILDFLDRN